MSIVVEPQHLLLIVIKLLVFDSLIIENDHVTVEAGKHSFTWIKHRANLPFIIIIIPLLGLDVYTSVEFFVPHLEVNVVDASFAWSIFINGGDPFISLSKVED